MQNGHMSRLPHPQTQTMQIHRGGLSMGVCIQWHSRPSSSLPASASPTGQISSREDSRWKPCSLSGGRPSKPRPAAGKRWRSVPLGYLPRLNLRALGSWDRPAGGKGQGRTGQACGRRPSTQMYVTVGADADRAPHRAPSHLMGPAAPGQLSSVGEPSVLRIICKHSISLLPGNSGSLLH